MSSAREDEPLWLGCIPSSILLAASLLASIAKLHVGGHDISAAVSLVMITILS